MKFRVKSKVIKVRCILQTLVFPLLLSAQSRGVKEQTGLVDPTNNGTTRALVIGISDYQNPEIPDLAYAVDDAEAFIAYLKSTKDVNRLNEDDLHILINQKATTGQLVNAFDWLIEESKPGDQCIIYFAGHGDVESKTRSQFGYLLTWDSPSRLYMGGAFPLIYLQDIVSTLSLDKKVRVILIADACHSGKLAGATIGGSQITGANLAKQFANEIKILSCQPNEFSIEGKQWGGGRGAFSYHLIDALYGLCDVNDDKRISFSEIDRYLEDKVTREVAPMEQTPMVVGNKSEILCKVLPHALIAHRAQKENQIMEFKQIESRGIEEEVLSKVDSVTRKRYYSFKQSLETHNFFRPYGSCAEDLYNVLVRDTALNRLHRSMQRNYAAALMDSHQQYFNYWVENKSRKNIAAPLFVFGEYKIELKRALELLGKQHYMYNLLNARMQMFMANELNWLFDVTRDRKFEDSALQLVINALHLESKNVFALNEFANIWFSKGDYRKALKYYEKAIKLNPFYDSPWGGQFVVYLLNSDYKKAIQSYNKLMELRPDYFVGRFFIDREFFIKGLATKVDEFLKTDRNFNAVYGLAGAHLLAIHQDRKAEDYLQKCLDINAEDLTAKYAMSLLQLFQRKYSSAINNLREINSHTAWAASDLALALSLNGKTEEALKLLQPIISNYGIVKSYRFMYPWVLSLQNSGHWKEAELALQEMKESLAENEIRKSFYFLAAYRQEMVTFQSAHSLRALKSIFESMQPTNYNLKWWIHFFICSDPLFDSIKNTNEFKSLAKDYFEWDFK